MPYDGVSYVTLTYVPGAETFRMRIGKQVFRAIGMPDRVDLTRIAPGVVAIVPGATYWTNRGAQPTRTAVISFGQRVFSELGLPEGVYATTLHGQAILIDRSEPSFSSDSSPGDRADLTIREGTRRHAKD